MYEPTSFGRLVRRTVALILLSCSLKGYAVEWGHEWPALQDVDLEVDANSILNFSNLVLPGPAGRYGWAEVKEGGVLGFKNRLEGIRLLSGSFQYAPANGGFPSKDEAKRIVTQLVRTGYGAVRLQCVDQNLMSGRKGDFDFDPEQWDRYLFLLSELKRQGVYTVFDVAYIDNGAWGNVFPHRWVKRFNFRRDLYFRDEARSHWKELVNRMLGTKNPYTGTTPLTDPATLALIFSNEGGVVELAFREGKGWDASVPEVYADPFRRWLLKTYRTDQVWRRAWEGEVKERESLDSRVDLPSRLRTRDNRQRDFMRFVVEMEKETYAWMKEYVRQRGFMGLTTSFNNWSWVQSDISRTVTDAVDVHAYFAHPVGFVEPGSTVAAESSLPRAAPHLRSLMSSRQWGKPFFVSEYGHAFWNAFRRESVALVPAYASLHGWDLLTQFSENSLQLSYRSPQANRRSAIFPFTVSTDPVRRTGERLAALLFARGDVSKSHNRIVYKLDSERALNENGGWSQLSETATRLGFISAIGLSPDPKPPAQGVVLTDSNDYFVDKSKAGYQVFANVNSNIRKLISGSGVLSEPGWLAFESGRFVSDTGELALDSRGGIFVVKTPRTNVILTSQSDGSTGLLRVSNMSVPALVAASSMDGEVLKSSKRVLLFVITDATNTGIKFSDAGHEKLLELGTLPARVQPIQVNVSISVRQGPIAFKAYAISQNGQRQDEIPVTASQEGVSMSIDTAALPHGPVTMFEIVAE